MAPTAPIRVLFVCTHNSARSQIAEALLQREGGSTFEAHSAGTEQTRVNPLAIQVLAEQGIDWSAARSKSVTAFVDQPFDYVVTVCDQARESCPVFPGARRTIHWGLEDPSKVEGTEQQRLEAFRRTSSELADRIRSFVTMAAGSSDRGSA